jgi:D-alanyl-lipoteichoic acid acyltransferase DltB (MBOAT superfamily)
MATEARKDARAVSPWKRSATIRERGPLVMFEYAAYAVTAAAIVVHSLRLIHRVSLRVAGECAQKVEPAWLPLLNGAGGIDMFDFQLQYLIRFAPLLVPAMLAYALVSRFSRRVLFPRNFGAHTALSVVLNVAVLTYVLRAGIVFTLLLVLANYFAIAKLAPHMPYKVFMVVQWTAHIAVLFINDAHQGYSLAMISPQLAWLDQSRPLLRWHTLFNMCTLRMISFNYDRWEAFQSSAEQRRDDVEAKHQTCADCVETKTPCYKRRMDSPRLPGEYGLLAYVAYITYVPLFIGGPVASFNAYVSHMHVPQRAVPLRRLAAYAARTAVIFACLVILLHVAHINCIKEHSDIFMSLQPTQIAAVGYLLLLFLWLKFSVIWKCFRLIALIDGVEAPEDMPTCFCDTTTIASFWRNWHSSFNVWIVRYMYIPMGGNQRRLVSVAPIFLFIAVWHDIELKMVGWAVVMLLAFIPEIAVQAVVAKHFRHLKAKPYWRLLQAFGCMSGTVGLTLANIVGFGTAQLKDSQEGANGVFAAGNMLAGVTTCVFIFCCNSVALRLDVVRGERLRDRRAAALELAKLQ